LAMICFFLSIHLTHSTTTPDPTGIPSSAPSEVPSGNPSGSPSGQPTMIPSGAPSSSPTDEPSGVPSAIPSREPSGIPSSSPSGGPTLIPSGQPSSSPLGSPSGEPSVSPSFEPTGSPSSIPSGNPSASPSQIPSGQPSTIPSGEPTLSPTSIPSGTPSIMPSGEPSGYPSTIPSGAPSICPSGEPSSEPSIIPSSAPSSIPSSIPTSAPSYVPEEWGLGQNVWDIKRNRRSGFCENLCSHQGTCEMNNNCKCYLGMNGEPAYTGADCSLRTCPKDFAWVASVVGANDLHPWVECSNKGLCNRQTGECECFAGYDGIACQRSVCPDNCNDRGTCWPQKIFAHRAGRIYTEPWDALKNVGCLCDTGYRGPACDQQECPSGADPLNGYGNEAGRECSGRGICNYKTGKCACFEGYYGSMCHKRSIHF